MKKILVTILCVVMAGTLLVGCGNTTTTTEAAGTADASQTTQNGKLPLVGFCTTSMSESIFVLEQEALEEIFDGVAEVQTVSCDKDSATQIQQIKNFATMGASLIVINPTDIRALSDAIKDAHNMGCKIYINGATTDELSEEYYDCCTVSDEYLCGAYVAMIAKNWIEAHEDELTAANPDWEVSFLISSLAEETVKRCKGEQSILDEYLKNWEGEYVDVSGNVVDEAHKVANPAFCKIAKERYNGVEMEQDANNISLTVSQVLSTNPNTRVFICFNSLASVQGGQYIVDNYSDQINEFAFFSAGVMGNEADYMVGSVSDGDGVYPSVMRGACQFGVSAAGGEVADSVARTAYAIMFGKEGVDYTKKNPDGIAAWWSVDKKWGNGLASTVHFSILEGATVRAFDPIKKLDDPDTITYWNSKDGFVEEIAAPETGKDATPAADDTVGETFTFSEDNAFGIHIDWTLKLNEDGTYVLTEVNDIVGQMSYEGTTYTRNGDNVECGPMKTGPEVFDWANPEGFKVTISGNTFTPVK